MSTRKLDARRIGGLALVLIAATGMTAGCASSGTTEDVEATPDDGSVVIEVENNLIPPATVTATVIANGVPVEVLGPVLSDQTQTFSYDTRRTVAPFRLQAELTDGRVLESRDIEVVSNARVRWDLNLNQVIVDSD